MRDLGLGLETVLVTLAFSYNKKMFACKYYKTAGRAAELFLKDGEARWVVNGPVTRITGMLTNTQKTINLKHDNHLQFFM